jgi:hypothetical protein
MATATQAMAHPTLKKPERPQSGVIFAPCRIEML